MDYYIEEQQEIGVGSNLNEKWKFRLYECYMIRNLIGSNSDFFVYGVPGCGKTSLIRDLFKNM